MNGLGAPLAVAAQVAAEVRTRLRSPATLVAVIAVFAGSILWIPDPKGNASSLSWTLADGRVQAPLYTAAYIGFAASTLTALTIALVGFYLVAGSVRRDRERGIGAILAATPLSNAQYLVGKFVAHVAYLLVVLCLALAAGVTAWLRFGVGPFSASDFLTLFLLLSLPAVTITAAGAVLFDVAPGLSGRGGYVAWFFAFSLLLVGLPMAMAGPGGANGLKRLPLVDPVGAATEAYLARQTVPGATGFATGLEIRDTPFERVAWPGVAVTPKFAAVRAFNLLVALLPIGLAVALFDRFDPARRARGLPRPSWLARVAARVRPASSDLQPLSGSPVHAASLAPVAARPSAARAIAAEARLIWEAAGPVRWPLAASALLAGFLPAPAAAVFFLLLVPVVSEVAARERLAGTGALVFSQPGVPSSPVLWKAASVALFLLVLAAPLAVRSFLASPERGLATIAGTLFVAGAAVGLGSLSAGGKLFSAVYLVLWYMAINGLPAADFPAALSQNPVPATSAAYLAAGVGLVLAAAWREKIRAAHD